MLHSAKEKRWIKHATYLARKKRNRKKRATCYGAAFQRWCYSPSQDASQVFYCQELTKLLALSMLLCYSTVKHGYTQSCFVQHRTVAECVLHSQKYNWLVLFNTTDCLYIPIWHILTITIPLPFVVIFVRHEKGNKPNHIKHYFLDRPS